MRLLLPALCVFALTACAGHRYGSSDDAIKAADLAVRSYQSRMLKDNKISVVAKWTGPKDGNGIIIGKDSRVERIPVFLVAPFKQHLNLTEARSYTVEMMQSFLTDINHNEGVRPYLSHYPISADRVLMVVRFLEEPITDPKNPVVPPAPYIAGIKIENGKVMYYSKNAVSGNIEEIHTEAYEEALRITHIRQG